MSNSETPYHILFLCVVISKKFPRLLAEREIIANAFCLSGFLPELSAKVQLLFIFHCPKAKKVWIFLGEDEKGPRWMAEVGVSRVP